MITFKELIIREILGNNKQRYWDTKDKQDIIVNDLVDTTIHKFDLLIDEVYLEGLDKVEATTDPMTILNSFRSLLKEKIK